MFQLSVLLVKIIFNLEKSRNRAALVIQQLRGATRKKKPAARRSRLDPGSTGGPVPGEPSTARRALRRRKLRRLFGGGGRLGCRFLLALFENERVTLAGDLAQAVHHGAGPGRDQAAHDDVLLEALERVDLAVDRGLGQHPRGFLERSRRDERAGLQ